MLRIRLFVTDNKKFIILICAISLLIIITIASLWGQSRNVAAISLQCDDVFLKYNRLNLQLKNENIAAFEKILKMSFEEPQLAKVSQAKFTYELLINGDKIKGKAPVTSDGEVNETDSINNTIYASTSTITIELTENYGVGTLELLPLSVIEIGSPLKKTDALDLVKISSNATKIETSVENKENGNSMAYVISDVESGEIVTIEIDPAIAKLLGLDDNVIEIFYNKVK